MKRNIVLVCTMIAVFWGCNTVMAVKSIEEVDSEIAQVENCTEENIEDANEDILMEYFDSIHEKNNAKMMENLITKPFILIDADEGNVAKNYLNMDVYESDSSILCVDKINGKIYKNAYDTKDLHIFIQVYPVPDPMLLKSSLSDMYEEMKRDYQAIMSQYDTYGIRGEVIDVNEDLDMLHVWGVAVPIHQIDSFAEGGRYEDSNIIIYGYLESEIVGNYIFQSALPYTYSGQVYSQNGFGAKLTGYSYEIPCEALDLRRKSLALNNIVEEKHLSSVWEEYGDYWMEKGEYFSAILCYESMNYAGDAECLKRAYYEWATELKSYGDYSTAVANFKLAIGYKDAKQQYEDIVKNHEIILYGSDADKITEYVQKAKYTCNNIDLCVQTYENYDGEACISLEFSNADTYMYQCVEKNSNDEFVSYQDTGKKIMMEIAYGGEISSKSNLAYIEYDKEANTFAISDVIVKVNDTIVDVSGIYYMNEDKIRN